MYVTSSSRPIIFIVICFILFPFYRHSSYWNFICFDFCLEIGCKCVNEHMFWYLIFCFVSLLDFFKFIIDVIELVYAIIIIMFVAWILYKLSMQLLKRCFLLFASLSLICWVFMSSILSLIKA